MNYLLAILLVSIISLPSLADAQTSEVKPTLAAISWLAGNWSSDERGRQVTEQWMSAAGGTMLGMSRTVSEGRTVDYEFLRLHVESNGEISYVAKPSGQAEATFKLIRASSTEAVFENLQHDFPQRITYTWMEGDKLTAVIEGTKKGKTRRIEFNYHRARS